MQIRTLTSDGTGPPQAAGAVAPVRGGAGWTWIDITVEPNDADPGAEIGTTLIDPLELDRILGWEATKTLESMCAEMVAADMSRVSRGVSY